jgi:RNA polymerase sigma factor (sigma-70 family)
MNPVNKKDRRLLEGCISGDRGAGESFVRNFSDLVYHTIQHTLTAKHISFSRNDLEDLHNTVFLMLFENNCKKLRQYRGENGCSPASWIKIVTVRIIFNQLRKKGVDTMAWQTKRYSLDELPELKGAEDGPWARMKKTEQNRLIKAGIKELPPRDRLFIVLHFEKGMTMKEVAKTMQLSVDNAYTVKHRAIQRLKLLVEAAVH